MATLDRSKISGLNRPKKPTLQAKPPEKEEIEPEKPMGGYAIGQKATMPKLKRTHVFLSPDIVSFIDDFVYKMKKEKGMRVTTSELTRVALRAFQDLPKDKQVALLLD